MENLSTEWYLRIRFGGTKLLVLAFLIAAAYLTTWVETISPVWAWLAFAGMATGVLFSRISLLPGAYMFLPVDILIGFCLLFPNAATAAQSLAFLLVFTYAISRVAIRLLCKMGIL